ncbi:MFS transporter [Paenibacillus turicensis]|uniref:MFS transporter n=1 Tax=Paenibacillus turicensis TaxID=160487 RepID=UPI003D2E40B5
MSLLRRNRGALLLLMLNIFIAFMGIGLVIPIMPSFMNELHISGQIVGLLVAAFSLTQFLVSPWSGRLSDQIGRKKMMIIGLLIFALSEFVFGLANDAWLLFIARFLGGAGAAFIMPAVMAYVADITTGEERAQGMGFINAAITTGFIIGPGIGGYIAEFGIRVPFYFAGVAGIVAALITIFILPESLTVAKREEIRANSNTTRESESLFSQLIRSYREPYFISLVIVFVMAFGLAEYETVFGLFVDHKFGFTPTDIAFVITFGSISGAVVQLTIFSWLLNKFGEHKVIATCLLVAGLFICLTLFVSGFWMIVAVTFTVFLAIDILRPAVGTQMSRMAGENQGFVAGMNSAYTSLGNIIGPIIAGGLFDIDINLPYVVAATVLLLCFVLALYSRKVMVKLQAGAKNG